MNSSLVSLSCFSLPFRPATTDDAYGTKKATLMGRTLTSRTFNSKDLSATVGSGEKGRDLQLLTSINEEIPNYSPFFFLGFWLTSKNRRPLFFFCLLKKKPFCSFVVQAVKGLEVPRLALEYVKNLLVMMSLQQKLWLETLSIFLRVMRLSSLTPRRQIYKVSGGHESSCDEGIFFLFFLLGFCFFLPVCLCVQIGRNITHFLYLILFRLRYSCPIGRWRLIPSIFTLSSNHGTGGRRGTVY